MSCVYETYRHLAIGAHVYDSDDSDKKWYWEDDGEDEDGGVGGGGEIPRTAEESLRSNE